jgi:hypothetical protein
MDPSKPPGSWGSTDPSERENRACPRISNHFKTYCQSLLAEDELPWSVEIREISYRGLSMVCHRHFEPGTVMRIGLMHRKQGTLTARAVHVSATPEGDWAIGCVFSEKLEDNELRNWLKDNP